MKAVYHVLLLIALIQVLAAAEGSTQPSAGRIFHLEDQLPDSVWIQVVPDSVRNDSTWHLGICMFTRTGQSFSQKMVTEMSRFVSEKLNGEIPVWEFFEPDSTKQDTLVRTWQSFPDEEWNLYQLMGLRVLPTMIVVDSDRILKKYIAGFSPQSINRLTEVLQPFYPELFPVHETVEYSRIEKKDSRRLALANQLYEQRKFPMVLRIVSYNDSLGIEARILRVKSHLNMGNISQAEVEFQDMMEKEGMENYSRYGLGIVEILKGNPEKGLEYLSSVKHTPRTSALNYWRARALEDVGRNEDARKIYARDLKDRLSQSGQLY